MSKRSAIYNWWTFPCCVYVKISSLPPGLQFGKARTQLAWHKKLPFNGEHLKLMGQVGEEFPTA